MPPSGIEYLRLQTPVGNLLLETRGRSVCSLSFSKTSRCVKRHPKTEVEHLAYNQLMRYFDKPHDRFTIPLSLSGQTTFRLRVWEILCEIKIGSTTSYKRVAQMLNTHPRAVGGACAANPIPIIIPCHRVVAQCGALCGYTGADGNQDLSIKAWLLNHEIRARVP